MSFRIAHLAKLVFDPPSSYIVPIAFIVAPPSYVSALPSFFVAVRDVFAAPPYCVIALSLKYVVVIVQSLWS